MFDFCVFISQETVTSIRSPNTSKSPDESAASDSCFEGLSCVLNLQGVSKKCTHS